MTANLEKTQETRSQQVSVDVPAELRVMHACERGASGVYRGHKCVARYFFRTNLDDLDSMRSHERQHSKIFADLLRQRNERLCYLSGLFFWGGLFYGVLVGMFGLRAIGTSTSVIETIVNKEFDLVLAKLNREEEPELKKIIEQVQLEELEHKQRGDLLAQGRMTESKFVARLARAGAYSAKFLALRL